MRRLDFDLLGYLEGLGIGTVIGVTFSGLGPEYRTLVLALGWVVFSIGFFARLRQRGGG